MIWLWALLPVVFVAGIYLGLRLAGQTLRVVQDELARLRLENADLLGRIGALTEGLIRIKRVENGLPEVPRAPRAAAVPAPPEVTRELLGIGDPRIRAFAAHGAIERVQRDGSFDKLRTELARPRQPAAEEVDR